MQTTGINPAVIIWLLPLAAIVFLLFSCIDSGVKTAKRKRFYKKIEALNAGDRVVTVQGMKGIVVKVGEDTVDLQFDGHCASFIKEAIDKIL